MTSMIISSEPFTLSLINIVPQDMMFRASADQLIDKLEDIASEHKSIIVDFSGTRSTTWSFAHQYVTKRNHIKNARITEANVPDDIKKMLTLVTKRLDSQKPLQGAVTHERPLKISNL